MNMGTGEYTTNTTEYKIKYGTTFHFIGGLGYGRHKIMSVPVSGDMFFPITNMLRVSVKHIREERQKQL